MISPILLSPAEEETRTALRPLLRALVRAPGALYNPVYIGPLRREDSLKMELAACLEEVSGAEREGLGSRFQVPQLVDVAALAEVCPLGPSLIVVTEGEASMLLRSDLDIAHDLQIIIWGALPASELGAFLQLKLQQGLIFDPSEHSGAATEWSMASTLSRAAAQQGAGSNPVLIVGASEMLPLLAAEAQLRLEVGGLSPVPVFQPHHLPDVGFWGELGRGAGVVVRVGGLGEKDRRRDVIHRIDAMARRHIQVAVVLESEAHDFLINDTAWRTLQARSTTLRAVVDEDFDAGSDLTWPLPSEVLLGAPRRREEIAQTFVFQLDAVPLDELLQMAEVWQRAGHFVLYSDDRFGYIEVAADEVLSAARIGDSEQAISAELVSARIRAMATWKQGQVVFVPWRGDQAPVRKFKGFLPLNAVSFDLTRVTDERRAGIVRDDPRVPPVPSLKPYQIAEALLAWGLGNSAISLLQRAERVSGWGVEEDLLLGHLSAERDPLEAVARLRHGVFRLAGEQAQDPLRMALQVDATLNALMLEVRGRQTRPGAAWAVVERWLDGAGEVWITTARHAAILFEIAMRAGQAEQAKRFYGMLVEKAGPEHSLVRALASHRRQLATVAQ